MIENSLYLEEVSIPGGPERQFDVLVFSDLRFPGGTSTSVSGALRCLKRGGYDVGLIHVASSVFSTNRPFHPEIVATIGEGCARLVPPSSQLLVSQLALFQNPLAFRTPLNIPFRVKAEKALLVLNQPVTNAVGEPYYDLETAIDHCQRVAHTDVTVAPISGISRDNFQKSSPRERNILTEDWTEIIDASAFTVDRRRFCGDFPVIGRHSRPGDEKWPGTADEMLAAYPARADVRVRILGVGPKVKELVGTPPSNWDVFHFGDLDVRYFLSTIDFWVYFHDPTWVESFGRAIAEAMASGAVTLLPKHFERNFSNGAIYCEPAEVLDVVDHLYRHPKEFRNWSERARTVIENDYSGDRYLERVHRLIGPPKNRVGDFDSTDDAASVDDKRPIAIGGATSQAPNTKQRYLDVVYMGDFCSGEEDWPRAAEEIGQLRRYRLKIGLVHLPAASTTRTVNADLLAQVHDGAAEPVNPMRSVINAKSVVLTVSTLEKILAERPIHHVFADQVVVLCDGLFGTESWPSFLHWLQQQVAEMFGGRCLFSAVRPSQYRVLQSANSVLPIGPPWVISAFKSGSETLRRTVRSIAPDLPWRVGMFSHPDESAGQSSTATGTDFIVPDDVWQAWWYGCPPTPPEQGEEMVFIDSTEMTVERFLAKVDAVAVLPSACRNGASYSAAWKALHSGLPVILPESWREDFGPGPLYRQPTEYRDTLRQLTDRPGFGREILNHAAFQLERTGASASDNHRKTAEALTAQVEPKPVRLRHSRRRRVLFMSSNGVGVGHLSRLIAIARRLPDPADPVFLSLSQALPIVRQFGFHGEFLPYHLSTLSDYEDWNGWLQLTLEQIFDAYSVGTVVFDGNMPYSGLCRAVSTRNNCRLVWVRRGMWRPDQDNTTHLSRSRFADLIIEPEDIASEWDTGEAASQRHEVVVVDPIRVLDADEILTRKESCRHLGLNQRKRYALIQLGAGNNYSNVDLIDRVVSSLGEIGKVQPVIAEWLTAEAPLDLWPEVPRLRCYPISRYYRAFDFTISAVGYNSFNEIISFGLPSVLVPNLNQMMDDQSARASYADSHQAAIHLDSDLRPMLREVIAAIHDDELRRNMIKGSRKLARPNGAQDAASIVARVAGIAGDPK